jgi:fluoride exporter
MRVLLVLLGGGIGSAARYLLSVWMAGRFGDGFPWGTLTVNAAGGFLIGLIATLADESGSIGSGARAFLVAGVLGGFTTFSAFSLETLRLFERDQPERALLNVAGNLLLALGGTALGIAAGRVVERSGRV